MSGKQAKRKRKAEQQEQPKTNMLMINHDEYRGKDEVIRYLLEKLKPFNGYKFISISAVGSVYKEGDNRQIALITVHWSLPNMNERGRYESAKDRVLEAIKVNDPNFKGVVIDKHGNGIIGNPLAPMNDVSNKVPSIGDEPPEEKNPFNGDESVESI